MEKEIKVRKKRFAAFWLTAALVCSLVIPVSANGTDATTETTTTETSTIETTTTETTTIETTTTETTVETTLSATVETTVETTSEPTAETTVETTSPPVKGPIMTSTAPKSGTTIDDLNGSNVTAGTAITYGSAFIVNYYDYDRTTLLGSYTIEANGSHTVASYFGSGAEDAFEGWNGSFVYKSGETAAANLYATFNASKIGKGTYYLETGTRYTLNGVQSVSGDSSVYPSGTTFYVPTSGTYTFS